MASVAIYATVPAVVVAAGIYFFDINHYRPKEHEGGVQASMKNMVAKAKQEVKKIEMPKLAPQFDGLHCFETLVGHHR
ncbi:hypothetical protein RGQ29_029769 [Quercus rubra]|uniref:Uncharacterized protein n=1 Tax=Quercus rubra TaxID=3512 RepID=A0AAN7EFQ4_QUERU|nr:hypothetical protein RGQ29_029769 [Quercus rubra]KAK4571062.1 hypothetical protein RGQ29_029769 [Quercus rubra]